MESNFFTIKIPKKTRAQRFYFQQGKKGFDYQEGTKIVVLYYVVSRTLATLVKFHEIQKKTGKRFKIYKADKLGGGGGVEALSNRAP